MDISLEEKKRMWTLIQTLRENCFNKFKAYEHEALRKKYTRKAFKGMGSRLRGMSRAYFDMWHELAKYFPTVELPDEDGK